MARKKRKRVASRGSVNNIILRTLVNGDKYGYEIIKEVEEYSNGKIILKQPSLYSSLTRFEEKKFVSSYWGDSDIGGRRHYYHLTEEGMEYYRRVVLKETDATDDEIEDDVQSVLEDNNIDLSNSSTTSHTEANDIDEELDEEDEFITMTEVSPDEIPQIANFDDETTDNNDDSVIIPDHQFSRVTPIESMVDNINTTTQSPTSYTMPTQNNLEEAVDTYVENTNTYEISYEEKINNLRNSAKLSNKKYIENNPKKLYFRKPKKVSKIILDSDGIYKLRDEDYVPRKREPEVIIDNVIRRSRPTGDVFGYTTYTSKTTQSNNTDTTKPATSSIELTEEEKRQKNENFVAKFNLLTMSKMKPVSAPVPKTEPVVEKKPEPKIDYRGKLNAIFENNNNVFIEDDIIEETTTENNMFNYVDEDKWNTTQPSTVMQTQTVDEEIDETEETLISFDEEETFETKTTNTEYIEEINTYTAPPTPVKMTRYDNITQAVLVDKTYLLNNKLKMIFGIIMSLLMVAEVTILMLVFRKLELIQPTDRTLFVIAYVLIAVFAIIYILPYFLNSNSHKANNFKLKYSIWFGILTFLICTILIYCFNALTGFDIDNFKYFAIRLFVPITLLFNFIVGPLVYSLLLKNKAFYD